MPQVSNGSSYLMNYYLGRQSIIEYAYQLAMMDYQMARASQQAQQELLQEREAAIRKSIDDYERLAIQLAADKEKAGRSNANAIIQGYVGIGNIRAKSAANKVDAARIAQQDTTSPGRVQTFIGTSSGDRSGKVGSKASAIAALDLQEAEIRNNFSGLTPEQLADSIFLLQDQVAAEMIGEGATPSDIKAVKSHIQSKYNSTAFKTPSALAQRRKDKKDEMIKLGAAGAPRQLQRYLDKLAAGDSIEAKRDALDDLVAATYADDGKFDPTTAQDKLYVDAVKAMPGYTDLLLADTDIGIAPNTPYAKLSKKQKQGFAKIGINDEASLRAHMKKAEEKAIGELFLQRMAAPEVQVAKKIGDQRVALGAVKQEIAGMKPISSDMYRKRAGELLTGQVGPALMSEEMLFDTKTREGRTQFQLYQKNLALEQELGKMSDTDRSMLQSAIITSQEYANEGTNAKKKYSKNQAAKTYADTVMRSYRNGQVSKKDMIKDLQQYIQTTNFNNPNDAAAFRRDALSLIYLDMYETDAIMKVVPKKFETSKDQPNVPPAKGFKFIQQQEPLSPFPQTAEQQKKGGQ